MKKALKQAPVVLALSLLLALPLAGCGRRGQLESPGPATASSPPAQEGRYSLGANKGGDDLDDAPLPAPKRPFILDSIL